MLHKDIIHSSYTSLNFLIKSNFPGSQNRSLSNIRKNLTVDFKGVTNHKRNIITTIILIL
jgi:hypothetical protein